MAKRRYALRDDQWERIEGFLLGREGHVGGTAKGNRRLVEAVLYRDRAGIAWCDLPDRFGDFRVIHTRQTRWSKGGIWPRIFWHLAQDADTKYAELGRGLIHPPTQTHRPLLSPPKAAFQQRCKFLNPAIDICVIDRNTPTSLSFEARSGQSSQSDMAFGSNVKVYGWSVFARS